MSQLDHGQIYKVLLRGLGKRLEVVAEQIMEIIEADRKAMREELTKEREAKGLLIEEREQLKAENERLYLHEKNRINDYYETTAKYKRDKIALESKVAEQDKENKELRETLGVMHYELTGLEPLLSIPERGYVRNLYKSILRHVEPYRTE